MKLRFAQIGNIAKYAITARNRKQLIKFEPELKEAGYVGVISNESTRAMPESFVIEGRETKLFNWIVLYHNSETKEKTYAFRDSKGSSKTNPPKIVSISKMKKILKEKA